MRIGFYAPLKDPDHPVPSGDRAMARLLVHALQAGGHSVEIVSTLRSFLATPDPHRIHMLEAAATAEQHRLRALWATSTGRPLDVWFTYHPFYKAPDLLGPGLAAALDIPYVTAEASDAPKRSEGAWARWHGANQGGIRAGAAHLCFTDRDRQGIAAMLGSTERLVDLPPFIDATVPTVRRPASRGTLQLVCVAMMRPGDKLRSYAALACALERLPSGLAWHLRIVGDGPAREAVHHHFAGIEADRLSWLGLLEAPAIEAQLCASDVFVWPGHNEAYGIAYLEAAACGLPALAFDSGGVSSVVLHRKTGLLVEDGDTAAYAENLAALLRDGHLRRRLGDAARDLVMHRRNLPAAVTILNQAFRQAAAVAMPL